MAHSTNRRHREAINTSVRQARRGAAAALEIDRFAAVVERAIINAGLEIGLDGLLKRGASDGLVAQYPPRALEFVRVVLAVETFGAQVVGGYGAVVVAIRGDSGQEIGAFGCCGFGHVAPEVGEGVAVCVLETDTGAVLEEGAVLDTPFKSVSVGYQGNVRVVKAESTFDVVLKTESVNVVGVVVTTCGADVGMCWFHAGVRRCNG